MLKLEKCNWFRINIFSANQDEIIELRSFYQSLINTPKMIEHMKIKNTNKPEPSKADMTLMIYSSKHRIPIVSNDRDFTSFKDELESNGFVYKIFPLIDINFHLF